MGSSAGPERMDTTYAAGSVRFFWETPSGAKIDPKIQRTNYRSEPDQFV